MKPMLFVPLFALLLACVVPWGSSTSYPQLDHELVDRVPIVPPVFELVDVEPALLASLEVNACTTAENEVEHEAQAVTAVRLGEQVPARRWFHHERGCVAF